MPADSLMAPLTDVAPDRRNLLPSDCRVALLTNFVPPYLVPLYEDFEKRVKQLRILISTPMESDRSWTPDWGCLDVKVLRGLQLHSKLNHPHNFDEAFWVHIPVDTYQRLREFQPDVIIACQLGIRSVQAALYAALNRNCRLIFWLTLSEYSELSRGRSRTFLRKILIPRANAILVNGKSAARYIRRLVPQCSEIFLAPYPSHHEPGSVHSIRPQYKLIYVGQLIERKGIVPFANILCEWACFNPKKGLELVMVGDGPQRKILEQIQLPPNLKLTFTGEISYPDIPRVFATGSILVLPTLADEWGLVVNEALAAGLPVLGSAYSQAVEELVRDGINGWVFRPDDRNSILSALDRALCTPEKELNQMRAAAISSVSHLRPATIAARVEDAVRYALGYRVGNQTD